jgi:hypothetical protein
VYEEEKKAKVIRTIYTQFLAKVTTGRTLMTTIQKYVYIRKVRRRSVVFKG